ncbi:MAG: arabinogalactan oligomer / maltooligosaccharide transport system substrate-binding protein [Thermotogota bacterium]|nr:arabinogalactan oligomer / maltooligosaccharide transport system substrate-binding protein [Thermotogota bacterium]MDK2865199.1 arabinogalactan oligomer / maltooligosaccharide transport system substrate-binding protein [Thermotogota bacterium]HCZ06278.1 maltose/maltodextrin ABC transporter substrate-binding protein MalE [Thermotogota bacterium]
MKRFLVVLLGLVVVASGVIFASEVGKLLIWADELRKPIIEDLGKQFTELYGVPVEVQEMPFGDIRDKLSVAGPAGEGPDIIIGAHDWLGQLVANGLIEPLNFMKEIKDKFVKTAIEAFTYGNKIYGLPYATEAIGLIYNRKLVPTPPKTWKELLEIARKLTHPEKKEYGFLTQASQPDPYHSFPFFTAYGGYIFGKNPDGTLNPCDIGLASEGAIKGAYLLLDLLKEGLVPEGIDYQTMTSLFNEGKVGMILTGPWAVAGARNSGIDVGVARIPTVEGHVPKPFVGVQGFMVSKFSKNKALAAFFLKDYVATKDTMLALYEADPRVPAYKPALDVVAQDPIVEGFAENIAVGIPMPAIPEMSAVWSAWADAITLFCSQKQSPEEALENAVMTIKKTLKCQ